MCLRALLRMSGHNCGKPLSVGEAGRMELARETVSHALFTHAGALRGFVQARVPTGDVDDVLQLAALRAVERSGSLDDPERVLAWLYTIHRNIISDVLRKGARSARWLDPTTEPPDAAAPLAEADVRCDCSVTQARGLSPNYASVLTLVDLRGVSLVEAASSLGITVNNATVRLHRARKALREAMLDHCGVQSARDCLDCRCVAEGCCAS